MAGIHFKESQKINLGWKWIFFIGLYVLMLWALVEQFSEESDIGAIISIVFSLIILVVFNVIVIIMKLETYIDETKISYQYKPFHIKPREVLWSEVSEFYTRDYKPIREYGGHGIQRRIRKGRAFTVSGNKGLQLILKDGRKILLGTNKPKELQMVIEKIKKHDF